MTNHQGRMTKFERDFSEPADFSQAHRTDMKRPGGLVGLEDFAPVACEREVSENPRESLESPRRRSVSTVEEDKIGVETGRYADDGPATPLPALQERDSRRTHRSPTGNPPVHPVQPKNRRRVRSPGDAGKPGKGRQP